MVRYPLTHHDTAAFNDVRSLLTQHDLAAFRVVRYLLTARHSIIQRGGLSPLLRQAQHRWQHMILLTWQPPLPCPAWNAEDGRGWRL